MPGDNVVWVTSDETVWSAVGARVLDANVGRRPTVVVATTPGEAARPDRRVDVIDASAGSASSRPGALVDVIEAYLRDHPPCVVCVPGFTALASRWGAADASAFFARTSPAMLEAAAVTYWWMSPKLGSSLLETVRQVTQVMLEVRDDQLHVTKAESRPVGVAGSVHDVRFEHGELVLRANPKAGRLAHGLATIRRELGLSQAQLAQIAGVTPSAISQAESGARGLSIDTLITLADGLDVTLDRLVSARPRPGYWLARHDRGRISHGRGVKALVGDAAAGLRAHFVLLEGAEVGEPPVDHRGSQLVVVVRGLVQVETDDDAPVLRAGDSLLTTSPPISRWRNLRQEPAAFYWVLRD